MESQVLEIIIIGITNAREGHHRTDPKTNQQSSSNRHCLGFNRRRFAAPSVLLALETKINEHETRACHTFYRPSQACYFFLKLTP